ncbi:MAG: hypothetical protein ACRDWS_09120 [Acidimicrobiia bacterium]
MKGLAALLMESMEAAQLAGESDWLWDHLVDELTTLDTALLAGSYSARPHMRSGGWMR